MFVFLPSIGATPQTILLCTLVRR